MDMLDNFSAVDLANQQFCVCIARNELRNNRSLLSAFCLF